jgi:hypothetical protein
MNAAQAGGSAQKPDYITIGAGAYDVLDDKTAGEGFMEYRWQTPIFWKISPFVGIMGTTDAAAYGYGGLAANINLGQNWIFNPNFALGAYSNGSGKDLGNGLEFRSGAELNYQFENQSRVGIVFNHISNASLGNSNPGTESLLLTYGIPVTSFTGR